MPPTDVDAGHARPFTVLALAGSLRRESTNRRLLDAAAAAAPGGIRCTVFDGLGQCPLFNPDHADRLPPAVQALAAAVRSADALIVATPEYAHGIPGALKNALDWLVGTDAFVAVPFALYRACPRSQHAPAALIEVLTTMSGLHVTAADVTINLFRDPARAPGILADPAHSPLFAASFEALRAAVATAAG